MPDIHIIAEEDRLATQKREMAQRKVSFRPRPCHAI